jgi:predicted ATPase/DNA-binding winged helix-turn-helix (wHTH) protein
MHLAPRSAARQTTSRSDVDNATYTFGPFQVNPALGALTRDGQRVSIGQRAFEVLVVLAERAGEVVSNSDIVARVWPTTVVDENNLRVHITALRKALGETQQRAPYILNVPGRGYRLAAPTQRLERGAMSCANVAADLPIPLMRLVGRAAFVEDIVGLLSDNRFVTIVGAGGIGKTSVALAAAHRIRHRYRDGCFFVDLAVLNDPQLVPSAIAEALRIPMASEDSLAVLVSHLRERHAALIFDNCEHVIDVVAQVVETILKNAANVHVLATSREPLRAEGESVRPLPALEAPPEIPISLSARAVLQFPAAELFAERATAAAGAFALTDADAPLLASLCRKLEGIPLAIELAAARMDTFELSGLITELDNRLQFLTNGRRTAQPRHRTLRATLDWSYRLLSHAEQTVLRRLGVFKAGFSRESAVEVLAGATIDANTVVEVLNTLITKSLVVLQFENDQICYRLLDMTRAYALEQLADDIDANALRRRHAQYFIDVLDAPGFEERANGANWLTGFRQIVAEIRGALQWCFSPAGEGSLGASLVASSWFVWDTLSLVDEYIGYARRALGVIDAPPGSIGKTEARILIALGKALYNAQGSIPELLALYRRAEQLGAKLGDEETRRLAVLGMWRYHQGLGEHEEAVQDADRYGRLHAGCLGQNIYLTMRGISNAYRGELQDARECISQALAQSGSVANSERAQFLYVPQVIHHTVLARVLWMQGHASDALESAEQSVALAIESGHALSVCFATALAGCPVALWAGEHAAAYRHRIFLEEYSGTLAVAFWRNFADVYRYCMASDIGSPGNRPQARYQDKSQWSYRHLEELSVLGEGLASKQMIERALSSDPIWCSAEVLRLEATRRLREEGASATASAMSMLALSLDIARRQGAYAWELRTAATEGDLLCLQGRVRDARDRLDIVLQRRPDDRDTPDYLVALQRLRRWSDSCSGVCQLEKAES